MIYTWAKKLLLAIAFCVMGGTVIGADGPEVAVVTEARTALKKKWLSLAGKLTAQTLLLIFCNRSLMKRAGRYALDVLFDEEDPKPATLRDYICNPICLIVLCTQVGACCEFCGNKYCERQYILVKQSCNGLIQSCGDFFLCKHCEESWDKCQGCVEKTCAKHPFVRKALDQFDLAPIPQHMD